MRIVGLVAILLAVSPSRSIAQDMSFIGDQAISMGSATLTQVMNNNIIDPRLRRGASPRQASRVGSPQNNDRVALAYSPSSSVRRQVEGEIVGRLQRKNPEAAAALADQVRQHDFGRIYEGLTRPFGLRASDTGDILTAYTTIGYLIANAAPDPSPTAVRGLRAQIAPRFAASAQLNTSSVRAKLGEELKVMFVTLHAGWQAARKEGNQRQYSDGVAAMFEQQGTELRRLRLTDQGFVAR